MVTDTESPLRFPCRFPIKAVGDAEEDFVEHVRGLVERHVGRLLEDDIRTHVSRQGTFIAVTITIEATSREQLDAIYQDLTASHRIKFAL
ncbi:MAG: hypothetical protein Kow006_05500 [Gammaproteobacteria bacterium]